jgi:regulator of sigma E protease
MGYLVSLLVLSALVFFHELGHYLVAKAVGVKVNVFSIGFGKKLFSFYKFNTQWSISAIPLGGYVKMKGQDDSDPSKKNYDLDSYTTKTPLQRIAILLAGPLANFVLAFFLYFAIGFGSINVLTPIIGTVIKDSPAEKAGLLKDDKIVQINNTKIDSWKDMAKIISLSNGPLDIVIERNGYLEHKILTPKLQTTKNMFKEDVKRKMIGISAKGVTHKKELTIFESLNYAKEQTIFASTMIFTGLKKLLIGDIPAKDLGGVVSIVKLTSDASEAGWISVFFFAALISVNLGILNLLPIPALDGGHIIFNSYELIFKKAVNEKIMINLTMAGWGVLLFLMLLGLFNDINRLIG